MRSFGERVGAETLAALTRLGVRRRFEPGDLLFLEGETADDVLLVESGLIKVYVTAIDGAELILGLYGRHELLCEMSALEWGPRSASGVGQTAGTVTLISGTAFRSFLRRRPENMQHVLAVVQQRLRRADAERLSYLTDDVAARVARKLLDWAGRYGHRSSERRIEVRNITRRELAQSVAANEKTVDEALAVLRRQGLIDTGRRLFVLLDVPKLANWTRQHTS